MKPGVWGAVHLGSETFTAARYLVAGHLAYTAATYTMDYGSLFTEHDKHSCHSCMTSGGGGVAVHLASEAVTAA
jgi:hypothetical protein